jgi:catechol 2,3-dioxygenase-like lactoylglutathione lyase family enzyme
MAEEVAAVAPELFVPDVDASLRFYVDTLGFKLIRTDPPGEGPHTFALLMLGEAVFMLAHERLAGDETRPRPGERRGRAIHVRVMVPDVDAMYERVRTKGVRIRVPVADREYGLRDFIIQDADGYDLRFAAPVRSAVMSDGH